jgi:hypothetical protein
MRVMPRRVLALSLAALLSSALAAQNRETLETKVVVTDKAITFKWSKKHPWDAELVAHGASLFAEYRTAQGVGVECLQLDGAAVNAGLTRARRAGGCFVGNAVWRRDDRTIEFQLPDALVAEPLGPVCLQLRLPDQRLLPVRQASKAGGDTARFQVEEWTRSVSGRAMRARLESRRTELTSAIATQRQEVAEQETSNKTKGWESVEACSTQTGGAVEIARSGRPIAAPNEQDAVARQVCTVRVVTGVKYRGVVRPPAEMIGYLETVDPALRKVWLQLRGAQLLQFLEDWKTYSGTVDAYKARHSQPHFGTYNDYIGIQSLAEAALNLVALAAQEKKPLDPTQVLGYAGATVEAYGRCVADGKQQLALNYKQATDLAAAVESLPERLRQQAVQACQAGVGRLATMQTRLQGFEGELAALESELKDLAAATTAIKIRARELNPVSCLP